ncbi:MAG: SDR family oxidoreductase [Promethearchaeota archaeon]
MSDNIKIDDSKKKILIIGANGFLGRTLIKYKNKNPIIDDEYSIIASSLNKKIFPQEIPFYNVDITNSKSVNKLFDKINPDIVILTAAMTNVDLCEIQKERATLVNYKGTLNVIKAIRNLDTRLTFISTDFIFDGKKKNGLYNENDKPNPISHYGLTKYMAEQALFESKIDFLICRTAVLYGWDDYKLNFITWIINKLRNREKIRIVTTQKNSPTYVINLAEIIYKLIEKNASGIFHTAGDGVYSRYEMAYKCAEFFDFEKENIIPVNKIKQHASRPENAGLDISKLKKFLGTEFKIYSLEDGLLRMKKEMIKN